MTFVIHKVTFVIFTAYEIYGKIYKRGSLYEKNPENNIDTLVCSVCSAVYLRFMEYDCLSSDKKLIGF